MGSFLHPLTLVGPAGEVSLEALMDTGASYTWIPGPVLEGLGARPTLRRRFVLADGRETEYDMALVTARLEGQELPTLCIFGDPNTEPLLGVVTLEEFGLEVDPAGQRLIPVPGRLKAAVRTPLRLPGPRAKSIHIFLERR